MQQSVSQLQYQYLTRVLSESPSMNNNPRTDTTVTRSSTCLLVASIFAPIHGGSANVYASLCRLSPKGSMIVLAARRNYERNEPIHGWEEHDNHCGYHVERLALLRPPILPPPTNRLVSAWRRLFIDLPIALQAIRRALQVISLHHVGVVCIGELNSSAWLGELCRRLTGCRLIYYIHGEEVTTRFEAGSFGKKRLQHLARADAIVAVSNFTRNTLLQLGLPTKRIHLIENAVDTEHFCPGPVDHQFIRKWGVEHKRLVVSIGRLVPRKGFDRSIEGWPSVLVQHPDAHLLIVGDGPQRGELESLVAYHDLQESVTLTGPLSDTDLLSAYRSAEFFMMPNRTMPDGDTEGFGLVFLEANACGRTVIGGKAGGAVEAVKDGETGLLVDGNAAEDIAGAVIRLLADPELRIRLEWNGLAHAQANSWTTRALQFRELCKDITKYAPK